jgi:hypothetical protein
MGAAMVIDTQIEPIVRSIFGAVVKRDEDKLDASLKAFPDSAARLEGLKLAIAICGFVVFDAYDGKPTTKEISLLAAEIASLEGWSALTTSEVDKFLDAVLNGKPLGDAFDPTTATMLTYIVTGCLLSSSVKLQEGEWWFNYLDRVEAAIEATPAP